MRIKRREWLDTLLQIQEGLSEREIIEQSNCFAFHKGRVYTFNDDIACSCALEAPFDGVVEAFSMLKILARMKKRKLNITLGKKEIVIASKRTKATLNLQCKIHLPVDKLSGMKGWKKLPKDFLQGIKWIEGCAGTNEAKFAQTCIHLTPKYVEACDTYQAGRWLMDLPIKKDVLIRKFTIANVAKLQPTMVCETKAWLHLRNADKTVLSCRRYSEVYPSLDKLLKPKGKILLLPEYTKAATDRAEIFTSQNSDDAVTISLKKNKATLFVRGVTGSITDVCEVKYNGPEISFSIPPNILRDTIERDRKCRVDDNVLRIARKKSFYTTALGV
jgi:hypothetical protein